jgi:hypothetical protein
MLRGRPVDPKEPFEVDLAEALGETIRGDREAAVAVYSALCNLEWTRPGAEPYTITWCDASMLISGIRAQGEHDLEFYYSGNEGTIDARVEAGLAARGWHPQTLVGAS